MVSGDRFSYIEMWVPLPKMGGLSRQVVSNGSGLSRQVSLYLAEVLLNKLEAIPHVPCKLSASF